MKYSRSDGFSLIEVMVALIVLSVGLLGVAKMQALSLSSTTVSSKRSLAALEAASLAATMHVNRGYWSKNDASIAVINVTGAVVSVTSGAPLLGGVLAAAVPDCKAGPCSVNNLAARDLINWAGALSALLPNDTATVSCGATPITCTILISWTESVVAINNQQSQVVSASAGLQNPSYTLYVEP